MPLPIRLEEGSLEADSLEVGSVEEGIFEEGSFGEVQLQGATGLSRCKFWVAGPPPLSSSKVGIQFSLFAARGERRLFFAEGMYYVHT